MSLRLYQNCIVLSEKYLFVLDNGHHPVAAALLLTAETDSDRQASNLRRHLPETSYMGGRWI
jgi:hypothetical protein